MTGSCARFSSIGKFPCSVGKYAGLSEFREWPHCRLRERVRCFGVRTRDQDGKRQRQLHTLWCSPTRVRFLAVDRHCWSDVVAVRLSLSAVVHYTRLSRTVDHFRFVRSVVMCGARYLPPYALRFSVDLRAQRIIENPNKSN